MKIITPLSIEKRNFSSQGNMLMPQKLQTKLQVSEGNIYSDILINDGMFVLPEVTSNNMITVLCNTTLPII